MIMLQLQDGQRELPAVAAMALGGEDVLIAVGDQKLRLAPTAADSGAKPGGTRVGRGAWKGRVTIPAAFHHAWDTEDIGEAGT
jgi:hypothetical protein